MNTGKILSIHDNMGKTWDRYTIVIDAQWNRDNKKLLSCIGSNENPFYHTGGFWQHSSCMRGRHLGKRIQFENLPFDVQKALVFEFRD